jgi:putative transposase
MEASGQGIVLSTWLFRCLLLHLAAKFGGMPVSDAKRLRDLEAENAQLKKLSRVDQRTDTQKLKNHLKRWFFN